MKKAKTWKEGDKVAIVSLSSGMLGEEFCSHNIKIGRKRLKEFCEKYGIFHNKQEGQLTYIKAVGRTVMMRLSDKQYESVYEHL